jgi:hypothetical protein
MPAPPVASKSTHVFTVRKNPKKPAPAKTARKNFFSPSLKLQRQAYCLETLRLHGIRSVFEIGCGEGDLLAALCEPASHRDEFPPHVAPESRGRSADLKRTIPRTPDNERELHIDRLAGIDINIERLWAAKEATKPPVEDPDEDFELTFGRRERCAALIHMRGLPQCDCIGGSPFESTSGKAALPITKKPSMATRPSWRARSSSTCTKRRCACLVPAL